MLGDSTVRNDFRGGRRNIRAGQEETIAGRSATRNASKIWNDAVALETATRKPGMPEWRDRQGGPDRSQEPAFRFHQHENRRLLSACEDAAGEATAVVQPRQYLPCPRSPRGRWRPYTRVQAHAERKEGGPRREPLCVRPDHRSRAEHGAEGEGAREGDGPRSPAGAMAWSTIRVSICARSCGEPDFIVWKAGKTTSCPIKTRAFERRFANA